MDPFPVYETKPEVDFATEFCKIGKFSTFIYP